VIAPAPRFLIVRGMSRGFLLLGFLLAGLVRSAFADDTLHLSKPAVRDEITGVIEAQLAAFRANDVAKAFGYAAAGMRSQRTVPAFARMVKENYPEIWQSTRAEFGLVRDDGKKARLIVHVFTKTGEAAYDYVLFKEEAGWRIGGVLRREEQAGGTI
jgi:hypothetical protein